MPVSLTKGPSSTISGTKPIRGMTVFGISRLRKLEKAGLIAKKPYQKNPVRYAYRLTEAGASLGSVLQAIIIWADEHIPGVQRPKSTGGL